MLGYVYVDLHSEEQVEKALKKNKDYIGEKWHIHCMSFIFQKTECILQNIIKRVNIFNG